MIDYCKIDRIWNFGIELTHFTYCPINNIDTFEMTQFKYPNVLWPRILGK